MINKDFDNIDDLYQKYIFQTIKKTCSWVYKREPIIVKEDFRILEEEFVPIMKRIFPWVQIKKITSHGDVGFSFEGNVNLYVKNKNKKNFISEITDDYVGGMLMRHRPGSDSKKWVCSKFTFSLSGNLFSPQMIARIDEDFPDGIFHNEECSKLNLPLLEQSLRSIRNAFGMSFYETHTVYTHYEPLIWQYGFKSEEQMKAEGLWRE